MISSDYKGSGRYEVLVNGVRRETFDVTSEKDFKRRQKVCSGRYFGRMEYRKVSV